VRFCIQHFYAEEFEVLRFNFISWLHVDSSPQIPNNNTNHQRRKQTQYRNPIK
jgi:hypothetical protein